MKARALVLAALLAGCRSDGTLAPAPRPEGSAGVTTGGAEPTPPSGTSGLVPRRTVGTRVPWGGPPGNLLVDGDFEHSIVPEGQGGQLGWFAFTTTNLADAYLRGETGGVCKSGLRCAVLAPGTFLYGRGTSDKDVGLLAGIWAKPPAERPCRVVHPYLVQCNATVITGGDLAPVAAEPDADGWCEYRGAAAPITASMCMVVEAQLLPGETALVDAATLLPSDGKAPLPALGPLGSDRAARLAAVAARIRARLPFGAPSRPLHPDLGPW
jgi:hypothetical protein